MQNEDDIRIPKHGKAGIWLAGVDLGDAWPTLISILAAFGVAKFFDAPFAAVVIGFAGFRLNKLYIEWKVGKLPGAFRRWLHSSGVLASLPKSWRGHLGYTPTIISRKDRRLGNPQIIYPKTNLHRNQED